MDRQIDREIVGHFETERIAGRKTYFTTQKIQVSQKVRHFAIQRPSRKFSNKIQIEKNKKKTDRHTEQ